MKHLSFKYPEVTGSSEVFVRQMEVKLPNSVVLDKINYGSEFFRFEYALTL